MLYGLLDISMGGMTAMRAGSFLCMLGMTVLLPVSGAQAQAYPGVQGRVYHGNDTGGIISWSCENEAWAPLIAATHCAQVSKYARITGVHRQYGDYISFNCLWAPNIDRFARPAVAVQRTCNRDPRQLWVK